MKPCKICDGPKSKPHDPYCVECRKKFKSDTKRRPCLGVECNKTVRGWAGKRFCSKCDTRRKKDSRDSYELPSFGGDWE